MADAGDEQSGDATETVDALELEAYASVTWDYEHAYPGGPPVGPPELIRPLYFQGNPSGKPASEPGPDVLAVKRAVWRGGRWRGPASRFDDAYSRSFALGCGGDLLDTGLAGFQRQMRIPASGQMGDDTYQALRYARVPEGLPHAGEPLFDATAVSLLEQAAAPPSSNVADVRAALADYCSRSILYAYGIHYAQERPILAFGVAPEDGFTTDCSGHATCAYYYAGAPDPNHRGFDGYGYTGTLLNNPDVENGAYEVGDLAIYGAPGTTGAHVVTCMRAGGAGAAEWCSHGSEEAPVRVALGYRSDLMTVVRPGLA